MRPLQLRFPEPELEQQFLLSYRAAARPWIRVSLVVALSTVLGFTVIKDLVVDLEPFFEKYRSIVPYLVNDSPAPPDSERLQSPAERAKYDDGTKCILCAACTTSCPPFWANKEFVGPAAIVNAHRFIFDSRDEGAEERLAILNTRNGVWRCRTVFNCTDACPRDIEITKAIEDVKRTLLFGKQS